MSAEIETKTRGPLPAAWPETVREALRAIQNPRADLDGRARYSGSLTTRRYRARVAALEAALHLSIATHGMEGRR